MKLSRVLLFLLFSLLAIGLFSTDAIASLLSDEPTLLLNAPTDPQSNNDPFDVQVQITDAAALTAWEFDLEYDPSLVQVTGVTPSDFVGATVDCDADTGRCAVALGPLNEDGKLSMGTYSYGVGAGSDGDGVLAVLHLQPTGATGTASLNLENPLLIDVDGTALVPTSQEASFEIAAPLDVTLASFELLPAADHILVSWATVSERNNLGFNVYRNTDEAAPTSSLNSNLILSQAPGSGQGFAYEWQDNEVEVGDTYYYWLESVDVNGVTKWHGPVTVTFSTPLAVTTTFFEAVPASRSLIALFLLAASAFLLLGGVYARRKLQ